MKLNSKSLALWAGLGVAAVWLVKAQAAAPIRQKVGDLYLSLTGGFRL